ncbi:MAG TPA: hypothetical protein VGP72_02550 [Planctomycetota bacterium]|jgi:hypothetical protein
MNLLRDRRVRLWLCVGLVALILSGIVQQRVEARRKEASLTWAQSEKGALEVSFLALGGFRGILADILWVRATRLQDAGRYYELKLLCDMILKLQPTFTQVHAFQAYNLSYNLAYRAETAEDKWYWIKSGLATLEKGLERNYRNYSLWFELGYQYFDRLGDIKVGNCKELVKKELPAIEDLTDDQRRTVFSGERAWKGSERADENLRYAAYYFWKSIETNTDPVPLRSERQFGQCIEHLGHWRAKKPAAECRNWDDWGSEEWWVEVIRRNVHDRGITDEFSVPTNLKFCLYEQMVFHLDKAERLKKEGKLEDAAASVKNAVEAYNRFEHYRRQNLFTETATNMPDLLKKYYDYRRANAETKRKNAGLPP